MTNNQSSSFCNLALEDGDLKKIEELDPFQMDGYQTFCRIILNVKIIYTNQNGKQTSDIQPLTLQVLTKLGRTQANKNKDIKSQTILDSLRIHIYSEDDIFLSMVSNVSASTFQALKTKNQLNLHFKDFPTSFFGMLKNCDKEGEGRNSIELRLSFQGTGRLVISQHTQYKQIELIELYFQGNSIEKAHQSIIYRYNYNKTKLSMIQNSIEAVYKLLAHKNPPLLAYIQKTVGNS